jgi:hypothetical protein
MIKLKKNSISKKDPKKKKQRERTENKFEIKIK